MDLILKSWKTKPLLKSLKSEVVIDFDCHLQVTFTFKCSYVCCCHMTDKPEIDCFLSIVCWQGIIGNDGRHYILDLLRTFPPDVNFLPGSMLFAAAVV